MALWTPEYIDQALWLDASDSSTLTLVSGAVAQWADKSGNGRHAAQATAGNRPTIGSMNGVQAIAFNGSTAWFSDLSAFSASYFLAAVRCDQVKAYAGAMTASSSELILDGSGLAVIKGGGYTTWINGALGTSIALNAPYIWGLSKAGNSAARAVGQEFNLKGSARAWNGLLAEILAFGALPDTEIQDKLTGYMAHRWGLSANLPSTHPYKLSAPTLPSVSGVITDRFGNPCARKVYAVSRPTDTTAPVILAHGLSDATTGAYELAIPTEEEVTRVVVSEDEAPLLNDLVDRVIPA